MIRKTSLILLGAAAGVAGTLLVTQPRIILSAKAAAAEGVPMIFSNQASRPMEACAEAMGEGARWFQLYWSTADDLVASFLERAEACGCDAIVVTLDTKMLGWRSRDLDFAHLPFATGRGIAQYTSDPVFRSMVEPGAVERSQGKARRIDDRR